MKLTSEQISELWRDSRAAVISGYEKVSLNPQTILALLDDLEEARKALCDVAHFAETALNVGEVYHTRVTMNNIMVKARYVALESRSTDPDAQTIAALRADLDKGSGG